MSGAGTNIGIDYQQRISSLVLLYMYKEYDLDTLFNVGSKLLAETVCFESNEKIDDLVILCENSSKNYLQIKKKLHFSDKTESEFYSIIKQFVAQHIKSSHYVEHYFLVTSTETSKKVRKELNKILENCRLNNTLTNEELNQSELKTLDEYKNLIRNIYMELQNEDISDTEILSLSKKIYVSEIDVYHNSTYEKTAFLLLSSLNFIEPELVWSLLVKNSLTYASQRMTIDKKRIKDILNKFTLEQSDPVTNQNELQLAINNYVIENDFACGKDVIITESFKPELEADYFLIELFRFDDDCGSRLKYNNESVIFKDGQEYRLIFRSSSVNGALRFIEQNKKMFENKSLCHITSEAMDTVEESACVILHKKKLKTIIESNKIIRNCLHCERTIDDTDSVIVEIDNLFQAENVGIVHMSCLRPIDRVIGTIKIPSKTSKIPNIDIHRWIDLLIKGQGQLNQLRDSNIKRPILIIAWDPTPPYDFDYKYCIKCILEDGSTVFVYRRGKIQRFSISEAQEKIDFFNDEMEKANSQKDPWCYTDKDLTFARYSQLLQHKNENEKILKIKSASISKYSSLDAKVFNRDIFYYAPLCLLMSEDSEEIVNLNNILPLISDPFSYEDIISSWASLEIALPTIKLKIIKSDEEFDSLIKTFIQDGLTPVIDPIFDMKGELVKGFVIADINQLDHLQANQPL
jgi:predicted RNA binding protein with dsRBD fold (UPF0201 family)